MSLFLWVVVVCGCIDLLVSLSTEKRTLITIALLCLQEGEKVHAEGSFFEPRSVGCI